VKIVERERERWGRWEEKGRRREKRGGELGRGVMHGVREEAV
jgi:hypothetical protein